MIRCYSRGWRSLTESTLLGSFNSSSHQSCHLKTINSSLYLSGGSLLLVDDDVLLRRSRSPDKRNTWRSLRRLFRLFATLIISSLVAHAALLSDRSTSSLITVLCYLHLPACLRLRGLAYLSVAVRLQVKPLHNPLAAHVLKLHSFISTVVGLA